MKFTESDGLPDQICKDCASQVSVAYKFKLRCEEVDVTLRSYSNNKEKVKDHADISPIEYIEPKVEINENQNSEKPNNELQSNKPEALLNNITAHNCENSNDSLDNLKDETESDSGYEKTIDGDMKIEEEKNKKLFVCKICQKSYVQQTGLVWHMRTHTGERPFLCNHCGEH